MYYIAYGIWFKNQTSKAPFASGEGSIKRERKTMEEPFALLWHQKLIAGLL